MSSLCPSPSWIVILVGLLAVLPRFATALDLVVVSDDGGNSYVSSSNGDGTFGPLTKIDQIGTSILARSRAAALADFDRDGDLDYVIATANENSNAMSPYLYKGNGDGTFQARIPLTPTPTSGLFVTGMIAADFDSDGKLDFVVNGHGTNVGFYWGNGDGTFVQETRSYPTVGRGLEAGDFNEDGIPDLARAEWFQNRVKVYRSNGDRSFTEVATLTIVGQDPYGLAAGDFDCDTHLDLLSSAGTDGSVRLFRGSGNGTFQAGVDVPELDVNNLSSFDAFDFNRDGFLDIVLVNYTGRRLSYSAGRGDGTFEPRVLVSGIALADALGIAAPPLPPEIDLRIEPSVASVSVGQAVNFSAAGTGIAAGDSFRWDFGDGSTATGQTTSHAYGAEGTYRVRLFHTDAEGIVRCRTGTVTAVGQPPIADPGGPYVFGEAASNQGTWTATLDGSGSTDEAGIASYAWAFGDGGTGTGATVTHTWAGPGPWTVTLTVTDTSGLTAAASTTVTFTPGAPPVASISGPTALGESVASAGVWPASFSAQGSSDDVGIWKYEWTFGNGASGSGITASANYNAPGTYTVTLLVYDHAGQTGTASQNVTVSAGAAPVAVIDGPARVDEANANAGRWSSSWDGSGSSDDAGVYRYEWTFGDGQTATGAQVAHEYAALGTYTVTLRVLDNALQSNTAAHVIVVAANDPPVAGIAPFGTVEGAMPLLLSAAPSTDDFGIYSYRWSLPPRRSEFSGLLIDADEWEIGAGVTQNERMLINGSLEIDWGTSYFFSQRTRVPRGAVFEGRIDTDSGVSTAMVGLKDLTDSGDRTHLLYAFLFNRQASSSTVTAARSGFSTGLSSTYTPGTSYDLRIVTKPTTGATLYLRPSGTGLPFQLLADLSVGNEPEFSLGAHVHSGVFGFDDFSVNQVVATGRDVTAVSLDGGPITLEVMDHALQSDVATGTFEVVTGAPPTALLSGPSTLDVGVEGIFSAFGSDDDYGIESYAWDFGDGNAQATSVPEARYFYTTAGSYTVTLVVRDYAGQSASASLPVVVSGQNLVKTVPWRLQGPIELPHETWSGKEVALKAVAPFATVPIDYTWDFGDGSSAVQATAATLDEAYALEARHVYSGTDDTPFTATITIVDADGRQASNTYPIVLRAKNLEVEMNVAIDEGLWFLHKAQQRTNIDSTTKGGYWQFDQYEAGVTASCVQAFEVNGHRETGDWVRDPYVETVSRGMNHLMTLLRHVNLTEQTYGSPDSNGNGIGINVLGDRPVYELGQIMDALVAGGRPELISRAGGVNVRGRPYRDLVEDMVDTFAWGQTDGPDPVGGGWRYSWNIDIDNSASQWAAIGLLAAQDVWGLTVPNWVKERSLVWLRHSSAPLSTDIAGNVTGGFGYQGSGYGEGTSPAGMVQLIFADVPPTDQLWRNAEDYIALTWSSFSNIQNIYALYTLAKAMRLTRPEPMTQFQATGKAWFLDPVDGLARKLVGRQDAATGSWISSSWIGPGDAGRPYSTAWALLCLSNSLFQEPPVAVVHARPNPGAIAKPVLFDASGSFHSDPAYQIVEYRWDFDAANGIDFSAPDDVGPVVTHNFGAAGSYSVTLRVKDNATPPGYDTASVTVEITPAPHPPTAVAGGPYLAAAGEDVVFDGSGSFDIDESDGDSIQAWDWETDFEQPLDFDDGLNGETATLVGGYATAGTRNVGLRVTDHTATVYPAAGQPDLTHTEFATVVVYQRYITDLIARAKGRKIQLRWTNPGGATPLHVQVFRSELGPNRGFELVGATHSVYSSFLDPNLELDRQYFYRLLVFAHDTEDHALGTPLGASASIAVRTETEAPSSGGALRITSVPPPEAEVGAEYVYDVQAFDPNGEALTFALLASPSGMAIDSGSGRITFTPIEAQLGLHDVFIEVRNASNETANQLYQLLVVPAANDAPIVEANGPYQGERGELIAFSSLGTFDPDGDPLAFTWSFGDGELSSDPNPTHVYQASGAFVATLVVTDGHGGTASDSASVQIGEPNRPPVAIVANGPSFRLPAGLELVLDGGPSYDLDGDPLTFTWNWGDSTPSSSGPTAAHVYALEGVYSASLGVEDGQGGTSSASFTVEVGPENQAPQAVIAIVKTGINPGDELVFDGSGSADLDGDPIAFTWDFGDGAATSGIVVSHVYNAPGNFTVTLTVRDSYQAQGTATLAIHINALPAFLSAPPVSVNEGDTVTYTPVLEDPDGDPISLVLVSAPAGMVLEGGVLTWTPDDPGVGDNLVTLRAVDPSGGAATQSFTLHVVNINDAPQIVSAPLTKATKGTPYVYEIVAIDPDDPSLAYRLVVGPVGMTVDAETGVVFWIPAQGQTGPQMVTVAVADPLGLEDSQTFTIDTKSGNHPPRIVSAPITTTREDEPYTYQVRVVDEDEGDTFTFGLADSPFGMTIGSEGLVEWTPATPGTFLITLFVSNEDAILFQSFVLTVIAQNDDPQFVTVPVTTALENQPYTYDADATDEDDPTTSLTYSLAASPAGMTIDASSGLVQWTPDVGGAVELVEILVRDGHGGEGIQSYSVAVTETTNDAPVIVSTPRLIAAVDLAYLYDVEVTDEENDPITFSLLTAPSGMTIDAGTGLISWTPTATDLGLRNVVVEARDPAGASDTQSFIVEVEEQNQPPEITSTPSTFALEDELYTYDVEAIDPNGHTLTYRLLSSPAGMSIHAATGLITWTPAAADIGDHSITVRVEDIFAEADTQAFTLSVVEVNDPPVISSSPVLRAEPGFPYVYGVVATDEEGDEMSYFLDVFPAGMSVAPTGIITWTPADSQLGTQPVSVRVADAFGAETTQTFAIEVVDLPHSPEVGTIADQTVMDPDLFSPIPLDAFVNDPDHLDADLTWSVAGNAALSVVVDENRVARITYAPGIRARETLVFRATDPEGNSDFTTATFAVIEPAGDRIPPVLAIDADPAEVPVGSAATITLRVEDNEGIAEVTATIEGGAALSLVEVGPDTYEALFTASAVGVYKIDARVTDLSGNEFSDWLEILAFDPAITSSNLTAEITAPADASIFTFDPAIIIGTAAGTDFLDYRLAYAPRGTEDFVEFSRGTAPVVNGQLGSLDPTLLENGLYTVRLVVRNRSPKSLTASRTLDVTGQAKPGFIHLSFDDKILQPTTVPIVITRTYDSRSTSPAEFGRGWRMSLSTPQLVLSQPIATGWGQIATGGFFPHYSVVQTRNHVVSIEFGNESPLHFVPELLPSAQALFPIQTLEAITFQPRGRTVGRLEPDEHPDLTSGIEGEITLLDFDFRPYTPTGYTYVAPEGNAYHFVRHLPGELRYSLDRITLPDGSQISLTATAILQDAEPIVRFTRDAENRILTVSDPADHPISYSYDVRGDLSRFTDELGYETVYRYDRLHHLLSILPPESSSYSSIEYDASGRVIAVTAPGGRRIEYTHNLSGQEELYRNRAGDITRVVYDSDGNILEITDPLGHPTTFDYDFDGRLASRTDALSRVTSYTYDARGNLASITEPHDATDDPDLFTTTYSYNLFNQITALTIPSGAQLQVTYDRSGNLVRITDETGGDILSRSFDDAGQLVEEATRNGETISYSFDHSDASLTASDSEGPLLVSHFDSNGNVIDVSTSDGEGRHSYDSRSRLTDVTLSTGDFLHFEYGPNDEWVDLTASTIPTLSRTFDDSGRLTSYSFADGTQALFSYDVAGRLRSEVLPGGTTSTFDYDPAGRMIRWAGPQGTRHTYTYDPAGRLVTATDANSNATHYEYTPSGHLSALTDANNNRWSFLYSPRQTITIDPTGHRTQQDSSSHGLLTRVTYADGTTREYSYLPTTGLEDGDDLLTLVTFADGSRQEYSYDQFDRLSSATTLGGSSPFLFTYVDGVIDSVVLPSGGRFSYSYDEHRRATLISSPDGPTVALEYTAHGQVSRRRTGASAIVTYDYDDAGRQTGWTLGNQDRFEFGYDAAGRLSAVTDSTGATRYSYDVNGNVAETLLSNGSRLRYNRDGAERLMTISWQGRNSSTWHETSYERDATGNIVHIDDSVAGTIALHYDSLNRPVRRTYPNGITTFYEYDPLHRLISVRHVDASGAVVLARAYTRNLLGEPTSVTSECERIIHYSYDAAHRITREEELDGAETAPRTRQYSWDAIGNRTFVEAADRSSVYGFDQGYRPHTITCSGTPEDYSFDDAGRIQCIRFGTDVRGFEYSDDNRLVRATSSRSAEAIEYVYDGTRLPSAVKVGDRIKTFVYGLAPDDESTVMHGWIDEGGRETGVVYGDRRPLARWDENGATYYLEDALGSIIGIAGSNGEILWTGDYDSFGNLVHQSFSTGFAPSDDFESDFRFQGLWFDHTAELYYAIERFMDPRLGLFLSPDPEPASMRSPETFHPYLFAYGNPLVFSDPSGRFGLIELNISVSVQDAIKAAESTAFNYVKNYIQDKAWSLTIEVLGRSAASLLPGGLEGFVGLRALQAGRDFENLLKHAACDVLDGTTYNDYLWLEVSVARHGKPKTNGVSCDNKSGLVIVPGYSRPDFLFSRHKPRKLRKDGSGRKSLVIGDIKLQISTMYRDYLKPGRKVGQWNAIVAHAKDYSLTHTALFLTLFGGKVKNLPAKALEAALFEAGLSQGVLVVIATAFPDRSWSSR